MPAQVRFSRNDVTDRFPMVSLRIHDEARPVQAEVAIGTDPSLFGPDGKKARNSGNFYSTRGNGAVRFSGTDASYVVPPEVLARFIGSEKLFVGIATAGDGGAMKVAVTPTATSPYISIKGLSGRSMSRVRVIPNRQQRAAGYGGNAQAQLDWAGDAAQPGMAPATSGNGAAPAVNGSGGDAPPPRAAPYDDGFGPMPGDTPPAADPAPTAQGLSRGRARGLTADDGPESRGIEGPAYSANPMGLSQARGLSTPPSDYPRASRFVASPNFDAGRGGKAIDRIVIHITDAPTTSSTVNHFSDAASKVSAHYLVGQDGEVVQFVSETDTAWHCKGSNQRSIGIEHVAVKAGGADYGSTHFDALAPSDTQYCESAALVTHLCDKYGLTPDRTTILGHREADSGTSHASCPDGNWNWDHFMDLVTNRYCKAQPVAGYGQGLSARAGQKWGRTMPAARATGRPTSPFSRAMIIGPDDVQRAQQYAPQWLDLWSFRCPAPIEQQIQARGMSIQRLADAVGELNLDRYEIRIDRFPAGWDGARLVADLRTNMDAYIDTRNTSFMPYDASDAAVLASSPLGAVLKLDVVGPDNAAVVISEVTPSHWRVATVTAPDTGSHPVTGTREWGYRTDESGATIIYTRGCDRATYGVADFAVWLGAEHLWNSFQAGIAAWANANGGAATVLTPFSERFHPGVVGILFGPAAQALSGGAWTINWDDVQLVPQPTDVSCWAASAAMLIGWRDQVSIAPESIAEIGRRSTAAGLRTTDNETFASEIGLVPAPAACYSEEGFRGLLTDYGPLWISEGTPPNRHAVLVTGMYSDGSDTYVRIADPWDRDVGTPGSPGSYAATHVTGSRYIMRWSDFAAAYEQMAKSSPLNSRILHAGGTAGRTPNTGPDTPVGYAQSYARSYKPPQARRMPAARALSGDPWTLNWDDVQLVPQTGDYDCWAAAAAMIIGWRDQMSLSDDTIKQICGRTGATGLDLPETETFAREMGLQVENPMCYTVDGFRSLLASKGPLWVGSARPGPHVTVATGMYFDGVNTYVRVADPWDRVVGSPGAPGPSLATHTTGSRYIMTFEDFMRSYEQAAMSFPDVTVQILHAGGVGLRQPNRGPITPPGYAQGLGRSHARSGALGTVVPSYSASDPRGILTQILDFFGRYGDWSTGVDMTRSMPHSAICQLQITRADGSLAGGTGFYAGPGLIATCAHCLVNAQSVRVFAGRTDGDFLTMFDVDPADWSIHPHFAATGDPYDIAVIRVQWAGGMAPNGNHFQVQDLQGGAGSKIIVSGYAGDNVNINRQHMDGTTIHELSPDGHHVFYNLQTSGGESGAPVLALLTDTDTDGWADAVRVVGIHVDAHSATRNKGVRLTPEKISWILNRGMVAPAAMSLANLEEDSLPAGITAAPSDAELQLAPPPPVRARALDVVGTIGGLLPTLISDSSGDISWELDQFRGLKHPGDKAPANPAPFTDAATIRLDDWPKLTGWGIDDIYAWFTVDWQHNGKSLGNIRIGNIGTNDAKLMKLKVRAQIMDDAILYEPGGIAALRVRFHYRFSRTPGDDVIAVTELQLFADGTYLRNSNWLQKSTI